MLAAVGMGGLVASVRWWPNAIIPYLPHRCLGLARQVGGRRFQSRRRDSAAFIIGSLARERLVQLVDLAVCAKADDPSIHAARALVLLTLSGDGYNHRMPSPYQSSIQSLLEKVLSAPIQSLSLEDQAIIQMALAELYSSSSDQSLREPIAAGYQKLMPPGAERRWSADYQYAALALTACRSTLSADIAPRSDQERFKAWRAGMDPHGDWMSNGENISYPNWARSAWEGYFAVSLGSGDPLFLISLKLPPGLKQTGSFASLWCTWANWGGISPEMDTPIYETLREAAFTQSPIFSSWNLDGYRPNTVEIRSWCLSIMQTQFLYQYYYK